jgi:hypothetical protein
MVGSARRQGRDCNTVQRNPLFKGVSLHVRVASGDNLRTGIAKSGSKLDPISQGLVSNAENITKSGNAVTITSGKTSTIPIDGDKLTVGKTVSFQVQTANGPAALTNIKGLSYQSGKITSTPQQAQVVRQNGHTLIRITASAKGPLGVPLGTHTRDVPID